MFAANSVSPAQIRDELSCGQSTVYVRTDRRTDRRTDADNDNTHLVWKDKGKKIIFDIIMPKGMLISSIISFNQIWFSCNEIDTHIRCLKSGQFVMPETCGNWFSLENSCVNFTLQTRDTRQVLPFYIKFKAPGELWKTVLIKCSVIQNENLQIYQN